MARPRNLVPTYRKHSATGRAVVSVRRPDGTRTETILPGKFGSRESRDAYDNLLARLRSNGGSLPGPSGRDDITIAELALKFMEHANDYYRHPITKEPTGEAAAFGEAFRPLCRLYADAPATAFGPLALQTLRQAMVSGSWFTGEELALRAKNKRPVGLARTTTNRHVARIKQLFKWASSVELVPASIHAALETVAGLRRGRSAARETEAVKPVSSALIDDTLPHLPPVVRDMVEILLLTGMRCGELCIMRACDLDMTGETWLFRPEQHKGLWRDKERVIAVGLKAQAIIRGYLVVNTSAYLFSPAQQEELVQAERRAKRKTPLYPAHLKRNDTKKKPSRKRPPGERFDVRGINHAIARACKKAGIDHWHTHQLRHSASLTFSREMGLEAARAALGHATVNMSAMYAGHDLEAAKSVAAKIG